MAWIFNMLTAYEKVKFRNLFLKENKQDNKTAKNQNEVYNLHSSEKIYNIHSSECCTVHLLRIIWRQIPFLLTTTSLSIIFIHLWTHVINFQRKRGENGYVSLDFPDAQKYLNLKILFKGTVERIRTFGWPFEGHYSRILKLQNYN